MNTDCIETCDCLDGMRNLPENSIDLIVTDPPYGISFMGKDWDKAVPSIDVWKECLRVLKSGAFAFIMSSPRIDVLSQMAIRLEKAGFNIGFTPIYWAYASGFPKSMNIGKAVDKRLGVERKRVENPNAIAFQYEGKNSKQFSNEAISNEAISLNGSYAGFQPKPAVEVIIVAMKPLSEKTYVDQALSNGKGITWLDNCRVPFEQCEEVKTSIGKGFGGSFRGGEKEAIELDNTKGRFPANLLVSDDVLNDGNVIKGTFGVHGRGSEIFAGGKGFANTLSEVGQTVGYGDSGSFSRYFSLDKWADKTFPFLIVPKASRGEKNKGLDGFEEKQMYKCDGSGNSLEIFGSTDGGRLARKNFHPTVKPLKLMSYLITLGSRPNDIILDPFIGSGTTAVSAKMLGRRYIGFEKNEEYAKIAKARLGSIQDNIGKFIENGVVVISK